MPIPFECTCGKKMSAKEEFAGRRLRCPECQRVVSIPKPGSGLIPISPIPPKAPSSRVPVQPSLSKSEGEATEATRPIRKGKLSPSAKTPNFDSPENLDALFATSMSRTPVIGSDPLPPIAPSAKAVPRPTDELTVTQIVQNTEPLTSFEHPWIDRSLQQIATPWRPGDEQRFQAGIAPARESESPLVWIVPIVALAAAIFLAI